MSAKGHHHMWQWHHGLHKLVCSTGCGQDYKEPTEKQTEARKRNFRKMQALGNLGRADANVRSLINLSNGDAVICLKVWQIQNNIECLEDMYKDWWRVHP